MTTLRRAVSRSCDVGEQRGLSGLKTLDGVTEVSYGRVLRELRNSLTKSLSECLCDS